jgi:outer membrane protein TolC
MFEAFLGFLKNGKTLGFIAEKTDILLSGSYFFGGLSHLCHTDRLRNRHYQLTISDETFRKKAIQQTTDLFLNGICTKENDNKGKSAMKKKKGLAHSTLCLLSLCFANSIFGSSLTLEDFLNQVREKNGTAQSSKLNIEANKAHIEDAELIYSTSLFLNASQMIDQRKTNNAAFQGTQTNNTTVSLGVSKLTNFGLQGKLYQSLSSTQIIGANSGFISMPNYIDVNPTLELTFSFWRNGFGSETRATEAQNATRFEATHYEESFRLKQLLADAEKAYWDLILNREIHQIQKDSLERAKVLKEWATRRTANDLADKSDLLQADAAYQLRVLDLENAENNLRTSSRAFNLVRGMDSDVVTESFPALSELNKGTLVLPKRQPYREDVKAAQANERGSIAKAAWGIEQYTPVLDVFLNTSLNGRNANFSDSATDAYSTRYPYFSFGLKFQAPLDFFTISDSKEAYIKEKKAATLTLSRKLLEQESSWKELSQKFEECKTRLELTKKIELAQKAKVELEKDRLKKARTTTAQVITFEQEYAAARLSRLRITVDLLNLLAQLKTFGA